MKLNESMAIVESILFACGDPVETEKLALASGLDTETAVRMTELLNDRYDESGSALRIIKLGSCYQLTARSEYVDYIRAAMETKKNTPLSQAAMEVLTIIAYNQPVTKGFVEHIRGTDSSSVVNSLVEKNLLEEAGRLDVPGKPIAYKTTNTFLRCFQLESIDDLPTVPDKENQLSFEELLIDGTEGNSEEAT